MHIFAAGSPEAGPRTPDSIVDWLSALPSPPRSRKRSMDQIESSAKRRRGDDPDSNADVGETTPRAPRKSHVSPAKSTTSTTTTDSTPKSTRSIRRLGDTIFAPSPIVCRDFALRDTDMPPALAAMLAPIRRYSRGIGVLPVSSKHSLSPSFDEFAFDHDNSRARLGPIPCALAVDKVVSRARRCWEGSHCEAEWNCRVHTAVLDLALDNDAYEASLDFMSCNTAQIEPKDLIPLHASGLRLQGKIVDFAICLKSDQYAIARMRKLATGADRFSINHTRHTPLLAAPITISIETKRPGEEWDMAQLQLGIWAAAHLTRLEQLSRQASGQASVMDVLPLIVIQGHDWSFLAASRTAPAGETTIWGKLPFGSTTTPLGVQQIVATLQHLALWSNTTYRQWLYDSVLRMPHDPTAESDAVADG